MVAPRQGNLKRKNGKPGNIRRFKPGQAGFKPQQHQQQLQRNNRNGLRNAAAIFNQNQIMDNTNQMMDNPGYMDFNEPTVRPPPLQKPNNPKIQQNGNKLNGNGQTNGGPQRHANGKNRRNGPTNNNSNQHQQRNGFNGGNNGRFGPPPRNQYPNGGQGFRGPPRMMPPPPMHHPNDFPPQFFPHQRFGPAPMMPAPIMMGPPLPPRRPMGPRRGPLPPPMAVALPPFRNNGLPRPVRRGKANGPTPNGPNNRRQNLKLGKGRKKGADRVKTTKKVSPPTANQYSLKKPWVTDEIREAHDKKVELANGLKGKKDDALFAEFKAQRDKFVSLYEAARTLHVGKNKVEVT